MLTPIRDRLVVSPVPTDNTKHSPNKFIMAPAALDKVKRGEVVAAGPGALSMSGELAPIAVQVGQTVLFADGAGTKVYSFGREFIVLREFEVLAIESEG